MQPNFQSSFIPKGPAAPSTGIPPSSLGRASAHPKDFLTLVGNFIFFLSVAFAVGVFGYKFYLIHSIEKSSSSIEEAKQRLEPEVVAQIVGLNDRILATKTLIDNHSLITPIFSTLQLSTPKSTVSFNSMSYTSTDQGNTINLAGVARDYSSLAVLSDTINQNTSIKNPVFSDLTLNDKGNVTFKFTAQVDSKMLSYRQKLDKDKVSSERLKALVATSTPASTATSSNALAPKATSTIATSTATSTPKKKP